MVKHIHFLGLDKDAATGEVRRVLGQGDAACRVRATVRWGLLLLPAAPYRGIEGWAAAGGACLGVRRHTSCNGCGSCVPPSNGPQAAYALSRTWAPHAEHISLQEAFGCGH